MLGALPIQAAHGQHQHAHRTRAWTAAPPAAELHYTRLRLDGDAGSPRADGLGARLMWHPSPVAGGSALLARADVGLYALHSVGRGQRFSTLGAGAVTDVHLFAEPIAGRLDPFLTLGAGVLRTSVDRAATPAPSPLLDGSRTAFTLVPGAGARLLLTPLVALQGDVRDMVAFHHGARHNVAVSAGLRLTY
jgi:hypothetical protein